MFNTVRFAISKFK